jgi:hypothetical protein
VGGNDFWIEKRWINLSVCYELNFYNLLGIVMEDYIEDVVVKLADFAGHLADLRLAFERTRRYGLKMNPNK